MLALDFLSLISERSSNFLFLHLFHIYVYKREEKRE